MVIRGQGEPDQVLESDLDDLSGTRTRHGNSTMRQEEFKKPIVPVAYVHLIVEVASSHGVNEELLLRRSGVPVELLDDPIARVSILQAGGLLVNAIELSGEQGLGYEVGLRSQLTSHGLTGYGLMSSPTLRDAIELGAEFLRLQVPVVSIELRTDGEYAVIEAVETFPLMFARQAVFDFFLVGLARLAPVLTNHRLGFEAIELWFDFDEPEYFSRFSSRLPPARFGMGANQTRFRAEELDHPHELANPVTVAMVKEQCRTELQQLGLAGDIVGQVRAVILRSHARGADLASVADVLAMSSRTLKRRLQEHGTNFQKITDAIRKSEAVRLVTTTTLTSEQIADRLGYSDASNFRRAFHGWTGTNPRAYRERAARPG